jgi:hypothetical protein
LWRRQNYSKHTGGGIDEREVVGTGNGRKEENNRLERGQALDAQTKEKGGRGQALGRKTGVFAQTQTAILYETPHCSDGARKFHAPTNWQPPAPPPR